MMTINYVLRENRLTSEPDDYMAMVISTRTVELQGVVDRMVERGSTVTKADILSVLEDFERALEGLLLEGVNVNLPFANFSSSIKGVFDSASDSFDATRHQVVPVVNPGRELRAVYRQGVSVQKQETVAVAPSLIDFIDLNTNERNSVLTPGGLGQISGNRLKFDPSDEQQGIFFVAADGTQTRVSVVGQNKPSTLIFLIPPELASGEYRLEVRAAMGLEVRTGSLKQVLSVA